MVDQGLRNRSQGPGQTRSLPGALEPSGWIALPPLATIESTILSDGSFAASDPVANGIGGSMKNPLDSLWGTIICGLLLTVLLYFAVKGILG